MAEAIVDDGFIQCNILGETFKLRCGNNKKKALEDAISSLNEKLSEMMKTNPSLSPLQAAIICALNIQNSLNEYLSADTPFTSKANNQMLKIRAVLEKIEND